MKTKKFDCVEMKRKGAESVYEKIVGLTRAEQLKFWHSGDGELRKMISAVKSKVKTPSHP